ncbi:MAG: alpha-galactosidase [Candidatus Helarchaeota archaeon]
MAEIELIEENHFINFRNGIVKIKYDLENGTFCLFDENENIEFIKNAISLIKLKIQSQKNVDNKKSFVEYKSTDSLQRTWKMKEISLYDGKKGKELIINHEMKNKMLNFDLIFTLHQGAPEIIIQLTLKNNSHEGVHVISFHPIYIKKNNQSELNLGTSIRNWKIFKMDWQSWSKAKVMSPFDPDPLAKSSLAKNVYFAYREPNRKKGLISGETFIDINVNNLNYNFLCGFITIENQFSQVLLNFDKKKEKLTFFSAISQADEFPLLKESELSSEKLLVSFMKNANPIENLTHYTDLLASFNGAITWEKVPKGWCSWYHYFDKITEAECLKNLDFLNKNKDKIPLDFFQIDDGFQIRAGDWEINNKFPNGMKFLAKEISEKGYVPGLWIAPFLVSTKSHLIKEHPDWFLRNKRGKYIIANLEGFENVSNRIFSVLKSNCYALDCTHPEVQDWLKDLFKKITQEWDFRYIKIDFIYAAALDGVHHDEKFTRAQAYRKGIEIIRETVGDDVFILGCGAPLTASIGIVNGMRVSTDTAPVWNPLVRKLASKLLKIEGVPSIVSAMHNNILLSIFHKKLWLNDPDCLMIRDQNTKLSDTEVKTQISIIGLTNGIYMLSDDFSKVSDQRIELIKKFLPLEINLNTALPIDLFDSDPKTPPSIYVLDVKTYDEWKVVGVINWKEKADTRKLSFKELNLEPNQKYHVFEYWQQKYLGVVSDSITLNNIEKHGCRLLKIKKIKNEPDLISSSFHFTQGAEINVVKYEKETNSIYLEASIPGVNKGSFAFYSPKSVKNLKADARLIECKQEIMNENLFKVDVEFKDKLELNIKIET